MSTFLHVFDVNVDDIFDKYKPIEPLEFTTVLKDGFYDWQLSFQESDENSSTHRNLPAVELKLNDQSENYSNSFVSLGVVFKIVTKTDVEPEKRANNLQFGLKKYAKESGIFESRIFYALTPWDFNVLHSAKIYPGNIFKIVCKLSIEKRYLCEFGRPIEIAENSELFSKTGDSDDDFHSDVTLLSSDNVEFKCHVNILRSNSTIFDAMFSGENFKESNTFPRNVKIPDIDSKTLKELLRFVYTKNMPQEIGDDLLEKVLYSSEKYDLQELKSMCENEFKFRLNAKNIFLCFEIAERYKLDSLMADCYELFKVFFHLFDENSLNDFFDQFPTLATAAYRLVFDFDDRK